MRPPPLDFVAMSPFLRNFVRPGQPIIDLTYFGYNQDGVVTFGATSEFSIEFQSDSDFVMTGMLFKGPVANLTGPFTIQIADKGTGKTLFNEATLTELVAGQNGAPFELPSPRVFMPNTKAIATINKLTAGAVHCWLTFIGVRIYYAEPGDALAVGTPQ